MDLTPPTADARLSVHDLRISLIPLAKYAGRTEGHTNPAGLAPGLIDIDPKFPILSLWPNPAPRRSQFSGAITFNRGILSFFQRSSLLLRHCSEGLPKACRRTCKVRFLIPLFQKPGLLFNSTIVPLDLADDLNQL